MAYKRLWVLLEGNDDERFFKGIIKPRLSPQYDSIQVWQYAQKPSKRTMNFLKAIKTISSGYFFLKDINDSPCVAAKKQNMERIYKGTINVDNIVVVVKEIESWYLAGLDDKGRKELGVKALRKTDNLTKEQFDRLIPRKFDSRIDFMAEILKRFSVDMAKQKNKSFNYFMTKLQVA